MREQFAHAVGVRANSETSSSWASRNKPERRPIVDVVIVVGDLIGEVGDLRFERRLAAAGENAPEFAEFCARSPRTMLRILRAPRR